MYSMLELCVIGLILIGYIVGTLVIGLFVQFVTYQLTGFSIYKFVGKLLK